jgi:hypothetical protein
MFTIALQNNSLESINTSKIEHQLLSKHNSYWVLILIVSQIVAIKNELI